MNKIPNLSIGVLFLVYLAACSPGQPPIPAGAAPTGELSGVEAIVREYFDHLAAYDYLGMRSMTTPSFEVLDGGVRLTHPELEDYIRNSAERRDAVLEFDLSQFNTKIMGDIAHVTFLMNLSNREYLDGVILQRSGQGWLFDRWFHSSGINERPEPIVRQFYHHIKAYNYEGMRTMVTPEFRIMYGGSSLDWEGFEKAQRAVEAEVGPASSRPRRFMYELSDFKVDSTPGADGKPEIVYASFVQTSSEGAGSTTLNSFVLRRIGPHWRVHFIGNMQKAE